MWLLNILLGLAYGVLMTLMLVQSSGNSWFVDVAINVDWYYACYRIIGRLDFLAGCSEGKFYFLCIEILPAKRWRKVVLGPGDFILLLAHVYSIWHLCLSFAWHNIIDKKWNVIIHSITTNLGFLWLIRQLSPDEDIFEMIHQTLICIKYCIGLVFGFFKNREH